MKKAKDQPESEPAELASLVGERIRKIRKEEGLSLELFALRCDMNAAYVGHIERGIQNQIGIAKRVIVDKVIQF